MPIGIWNNRPILLAPSILAVDFARLGEDVRAADAGGADWFQADIMDGHFVPNISFGPSIVAALSANTRCLVDVHLMIEQPERYIDDYVRAGARNITVHIEACRHLHRVIQQIKAAGTTAGVALDLVLVMTVNPGFGGQQFIASSLDKIRRMRERLDARGLHHLPIQVDGGISAQNVRAVVEAGAENIVAGSSVFGHKAGIAHSIEEFRAALR
jgi:ribulose-phosphate 3-epimerase